MSSVEAVRLCCNCKAEVKKLALSEADKRDIYRWFLAPEVSCDTCASVFSCDYE